MGAFHETERPRTRCAVFVPLARHGAKASSDASDATRRTEGHDRSSQARLEEAIGLARAIDLDIVADDVSQVPVIRPSTFYGGGKVGELGGTLAIHDVDVALVDAALTPVQQRNLERAWNTKVLDRTGIILEIFGARAQTKEGKLQVDLAALRYQRGRLVRSWTHLERQRGGGGFLGGPGETQIEADRRALQTKIERLEKQLEQVRRTRGLHRKQRQKQDVPTVALVGYTNAGKSTLFNIVTDANVLSKDLLFATLDPTLRKVTLPNGTPAILSDTVGFISNLPTDLVAAFRATLEEVTEARIIIHVRDIAHEDSKAQAADVEAVLGDMGIDPADGDQLKRDGRAYLEVWNKIDLLDGETRNHLEEQGRGQDSIILVSAHTGYGLDDLKGEIERVLNEDRPVRQVILNELQLQSQHLLYEYGTVLGKSMTEDGRWAFSVRSDRWPKIYEVFDIIS